MNLEEKADLNRRIKQCDWSQAVRNDMQMVHNSDKTGEAAFEAAWLTILHETFPGFRIKAFKYRNPDKLTGKLLEIDAAAVLTVVQLESDNFEVPCCFVELKDIKYFRGPKHRAKSYFQTLQRFVDQRKLLWDSPEAAQREAMARYQGMYGIVAYGFTHAAIVRYDPLQDSTLPSLDFTKRVGDLVPSEIFNVNILTRKGFLTMHAVAAQVRGWVVSAGFIESFGHSLTDNSGQPVGSADDLPRYTLSDSDEPDLGQELDLFVRYKKGHHRAAHASKAPPAPEPDDLEDDRDGASVAGSDECEYEASEDDISLKEDSGGERGESEESEGGAIGNRRIDRSDEDDDDDDDSDGRGVGDSLPRNYHSDPDSDTKADAGSDSLEEDPRTYAEEDARARAIRRYTQHPDPRMMTSLTSKPASVYNEEYGLMLPKRSGPSRVPHRPGVLSAGRDLGLPSSPPRHRPSASQTRSPLSGVPDSE